MSEDKEIWEVRLTESIVGLVFKGARKNGRGPWLDYDQLPDPVKSYLMLEVLPGAAGNVVVGDSGLKTLDALEEVLDRDEKDRFGMRRGLDAVIWVNVDKERKRPPRKIPPGTPAIRNLQDLVEHFGAETVSGLPRRVYKDTDCGAWISLETPDGVWHHTGDDWSGITEISAFKIGTIIEGSDAEISSDPFELPVTNAEVDHWIRDMETEASDLWNEANGPEGELDEDDDFFETPPGPKDWSPLKDYPPE